MEDEITAAKMQAMSQAIIATIKSTGNVENMTIVMGALGATVGVLALATGRPDAAIHSMTEIAHTVCRQASEGSDG